MTHIPVDQIVPNPEQPRKDFEGIDELARSMREHAQISPIQVRPHGDGYEIVTGERRWRAAKLAGLESLRAEVIEVTDEEAFQFALLENLQREDLSAIEEAQAYQRLIEQGNTQEEIAGLIGKSQQYVADRLALLRLEEPVQAMVTAHVVSPSVGRELSKLEPEEQVKVANRSKTEKLTVRKVQHAVRQLAQRRDSIERDELSRDQLITEVLRRWPTLEPFADGLRANQIYLLGYPLANGDIDDYKPRLSIRLTSDFAGQAWPWPKFSGELLRVATAADPDADEEIRRTYPLFDPDEWDEWQAFVPRDALVGLLPMGGISWSVPDLVRSMHWTFHRRTYCPTYGGFFTDTDDYVRRGWGSWVVVDFNDGTGGRTSRRVFLHDHFNSLFVDEARRSISQDATNAFEMQNLRIWQVLQYEMGRFQCDLVHYPTEEVLDFMAQDIEDLRRFKELCESSKDDALVEWLQHFIPMWPDGFNQGRISLPRNDDGSADRSRWSDYKKEVEARANLVRDPELPGGPAFVIDSNEK